jgi:hypothetical protein
VKKLKHFNKEKQEGKACCFGVFAADTSRVHGLICDESVVNLKERRKNGLEFKISQKLNEFSYKFRLEGLFFKIQNRKNC